MTTDTLLDKKHALFWFECEVPLYWRFKNTPELRRVDNIGQIANADAHKVEFRFSPEVLLCYKIDTKRCVVTVVPWLGSWPDTGGFVNSYGGMAGVANEDVFQTRANAENALRASIVRQMHYYTRKLSVLSMAQKRLSP